MVELETTYYYFWGDSHLGNLYYISQSSLRTQVLRETELWETYLCKELAYIIVKAVESEK